MHRKLLNRLLEDPALFNLMRTRVSGDFSRIRHELVSAGSGRVLDIACGTAFYSRDLYSGRETFYCGLDKSPAYIAYAVRNFGNGRFVIGDAFKLPIARHSFDAVLSLAFLHHVSDEEVFSIFEEVHRVLKPGGAFVIAEPILFFRFLRFFLVPKRIMVGLDRGRYVRRPDAYRALFTPGFTLLREYPFRNGPHDWWIFILRKRAEGEPPDAAR